MSSIKTKIKSIKKEIEKYGLNVSNIGASGTMTDEELYDYLVGVHADIVRNKTNDSTKLNKKLDVVDESQFYLGFMSDTHSKLYLMENYLELLNDINGKCVVLGDISNGSNLAGATEHHHSDLLNSTLNLSHDILAMSDIYKRYSDMMIGSIEGNHDQWSSEFTGVHVGKEACKIAGISEGA